MKDFIRQKIRENLLTEGRIKFKINVPKDARIIHDAFVKRGHEMFVVGGAVRDALMGITPKDWDLATDAHPDKIQEILRTLPIVKSIKLVGERFGIIMATTESDEFEIATFQERDESKLQSTGEVDVKFSDMEGDISRRDLTINALFYDISTGEVIDLVGGVNDIKNNVIRSVGKPEDRFEDDSIRKLRSIRFAARTNSQLDPEIAKALKADPKIHPIVSFEARFKEFNSGINQAKDVSKYFQLLKDFNLWDELVPPSFGIKLNGFINEKDKAVLLAVLFNQNDPVELRKKLSGKGETLKYDSPLADTIEFLIKLKDLNLDNVISLKRKQKASPEQILSFAKWINLDMKVMNAFAKFQLSVKGADAEKLGAKKGTPEMGQTIAKMELDNFKRLL